MTMHDMTTPKMTRVTVRVPRATLDQINRWVDTLGVRRSHFLGIALVAGARSLIRASALEMVPMPDDRMSPGDDASAEIGEAANGDAVNEADAEATEGVASEIAALRAEVAALRDRLAALVPKSQERPPASDDPQ